MSNFGPYTHQKLIKLFDFLDSETLEARYWVKSYLTKQGMLAPSEALLSVESYVFNLVNSQIQNFSEIEKLARKMRNAWRVRRHRQNEHVRTLSVGLERSVSAKLAQMSKGTTQADVITLLIEGNYPAFLTMKNEQKVKAAEAKRILQMKRDNDRHQRLLSKFLANATEIDNQPDLKDDLREGLANLYNIIFLANEQGRAIDDQTLLQATKIYYAVFAK